jgi:hypothetical protein
MNRWQSTLVRRVAGAIGIACLLGVPDVFAEDQLIWRPKDNRVDAEIASWDVPKLLEHLATLTDWQIYLEPGTRHTVSTKFKDRTPGEALRLLLGDLSFALLPQTNGPSKLFVFRTSLGDATQLIKPPPGPLAKTAKPIPNELVVTLKPGAKIEDVARRVGAKVLGKVDGLNAYRLQFDNAEATTKAREALSTDEDVESVEYNYAVYHDPPLQALTASSMPPLNLKVKAVGDGERLIVGLVDTPLHAGCGGADAFLLPPLSVLSPSQLTSPELTHGDAMAQSILRGVSTAVTSSDGTRVRILPVDVYGNSESTTTFQVAQGIAKAVNSGAMIVNLSLGSDGDTPVLKQVIQDARRQGVLFFGAAGNRPVTTPTYPAAYPEVIAVSAANSTGQILSWANRGDFVDIVAPGSNIVNCDGASYATTGTSTSSALASGSAAGLADKPGRTLSEVESLIRAEMAPKTK